MTDEENKAGENKKEEQSQTENDSASTSSEENKEVSDKDQKKEEEKPDSEKEREKRQNRQLRNFLIVLGLVLVLTVGLLYLYNQPEKIQYKNLEFESYTDEGGITFYQEGIPEFKPDGEPFREELFYLRTHPDKLKNISFNGTMKFEESLLISTSGNAFKCDGRGAISTGNVANLYKFVGIDTETTQNVTQCNPLDNTANLRLVKGNKTSLSQTGPACYKATIADCEILPATEKFMVETISKVHKNIDEGLNRSS